MTADEEEILKQTIVDEIAAEEPEPEKTLEDVLREKSLIQRRKRFKRVMLLALLALFSYAFYWLFKPIQGTLSYGICKTFLELNVPYPQTIHISEALTLRDGSVKLWYAHIDAFGEYRMEYFKCVFRPDPQTGATVLARVEHNRLEMEQEKVELFNNAIPYLVTNPPDLTVPTKLPDKLQDLQIETEKFRKPIL